MTNLMTIFAIYLALFGLLSCSSDVEDKSDQVNASTFSLQDVQLRSSRSFSSDPMWPELKDTNITNLTVCAIDNVTRDQLAGVEFDIKTENTDTTVVSDADGCFHWQESFNFDYSADETFYLIKGRVTGSDNFKGVQNIKIAINPWAMTLVDMQRGGTVGKLSALGNKMYAKSLYDQIDIKENIIVDITDIRYEQDQGALISMDVITRPALIRKNIDDTQTQAELFTSGEFEVEYLLVKRQQGTNEKTIVAQAYDTPTINLEGFTKSEDVTFEVRDLIEAGDTLELAMKIVPTGKAKSLGSYFGTTVLQNLNFGKQAYPVSKNTYNLRQLKSISKNQKRTFTQHGFIISNITGDYKNDDGIANGAYSLGVRERKAMIRINIVDSIFHQGVNSSFKVSILDTVEDEIIGPYTKSTLIQKNSGIFEQIVDFGFDEEFEYNYRKYIVRVEGIEAPYEGITTERVVYINPRLRGNGFLFDGDDLKEGERPGQDISNNPKIYISNYRIDGEEESDAKKFFVNKDLRLLTNRKVRLTIRPKLRLPHNFESDLDDVELPNGEYKLKFMVASPLNEYKQVYNQDLDLNDFYILTGDEGIFKVNGGIIEAEFDLPHLFDEKQYLTFLNIGILSIEPVNVDSQIQGSVHIGKVSILRKWQNVESIYDSSIGDSKRINLQQGNYEVARKFAKEIKNIKNKLEDDKVLNDPFFDFKNYAADNYVADQVPVINHHSYKVELANTKMIVSDTEEQFLERHPIVDLDKDDLNLIFDTNNFDNEIASELCKLFYDPNQETVQVFHTPGESNIGRYQEITFHGIEYKECARNPGEFLHMKSLKFMNKITKQPGVVEEESIGSVVTQERMSLVRNDAYFNSKGEMFSEIQGERISKRVGIGNHTSLDVSGKILKPLSFFSALGPEMSISKDHYTMSQMAGIESNQRRIINQNGKSYVVTKTNVGFEALVRNCYLIAPKYVKAHVPQRHVNSVGGIKALINWFTDTDERKVVTSPIRHLICKETLSEEFIDESFYYVKVADPAAADQGDLSMAKNLTGQIIRGEMAFKEFRQLDLANDLQTIYNHPTKEAKLRAEYERRKIEDPNFDPYNSYMIWKSDSSENVKRYKYFIEHMGKSLQYKDKLGRGFPGLYEPTHELHKLLEKAMTYKE